MRANGTGVNCDFREHLDRFIADNFPMRSSEFTAGTAKYNEYINAINKVGSMFTQIIEFCYVLFVKLGNLVLCARFPNSNGAAVEV